MQTSESSPDALVMSDGYRYRTDLHKNTMTQHQQVASGYISNEKVVRFYRSLTYNGAQLGV